MISADIPVSFRTERLHLRCWHADDAPALLPILEANTEHLREWIPEQIWTPAPLPELEERLNVFAENFAAERECRFAILLPGDGKLLGEAALFARSAEGRVPFAEADRLEIGYWLRSDETGHGYATEAARALFDIAVSLPGMKRVEIRCDPRNRASAAVPKRLHFELAEGNTSETDLMIWYYDLAGSD